MFVPANTARQRNLWGPDFGSAAEGVKVIITCYYCSLLLLLLSIVTLIVNHCQLLLLLLSLFFLPSLLLRFRYAQVLGLNAASLHGVGDLLWHASAVPFTVPFAMPAGGL